MIRNRASFVKCAPMLAALCLVVAPVGAQEPALDSQRTNTLAEGIVVSDGHLTINVDNIDITQLLRMLSVKRRVSIVAGPRVSGAVSLNLYDVTFEEALRAILDVSGCTATYKGDVILVTGASEKALLPLDTADLHIKVFKLDYLDPNEALTIVQQFISPAGRVVASNIEYTLLVEDTLAYVERISSLVEQIDVAPKQVLIEATLLEIVHDDDLTFGVELGVTQINGNTIFRALTSGFAQDVTALPETAQGMFAGILTEDTETFVEALAEVGNVKMLANPKILAVNRQKAQIIIGERLGFRITTTTETSSLESVEFLEVGTQLTLTPQISSDGTVLLDIHPEVSDGNVSVLGLPSERTAEATTYMLVKDGQTVVLGGLIQERTSDQVAKVPLLGDIPLLGYLFRRTTKSKTVNELVVLITPHIMGPEPDYAMRETIGNVEEIATARESILYGERERSSHTVRTPPFRPRGALAHIEEPSAMTAEPAPADLEDATPAPLVQPRLEEASDVATANEPAETASSALATPGHEVDEAAASSFSDVVQSLLGAREEKAQTAAADKSESSMIEQGRYSVQVFAARNERITGDYVASLQQDGLPAWVKPPDLTAGDEWYRAMIGRFSTRAHAKENLKNLQQGRVFADAFVRDHASENAAEKDERAICTRDRTRIWSTSSRQTHDGRKEGL